MHTVANDTPGLERALVARRPERRGGEERPLPVQLLGRWWALVRLGEGGTVAAFEDRCPHRLAPLSIGTVVDGELRCGYHGWRFDGTGACTAIPALATARRCRQRPGPSRPHAVEERHGIVGWPRPRPSASLPDFPSGRPGRFERSVQRTPAARRPAPTSWSTTSSTPPTCPIVAHRHLRRASPIVPAAVRGRADGWSVGTTYRAPYRNYDDPLVATGEHDLVQPHDYQVVPARRHAALVRLEFPVTGRTLAILFACQPESATSTRLYKLVAHDDGAPMAETVEFEDRVLDEDLAVLLESYRDQRVHLDARAEVHTQADRLGVAFRRLRRRPARRRHRLPTE